MIVCSCKWKNIFNSIENDKIKILQIKMLLIICNNKIIKSSNKNVTFLRRRKNTQDMGFGMEIFNKDELFIMKFDVVVVGVGVEDFRCF